MIYFFLPQISYLCQFNAKQYNHNIKVVEEEEEGGLQSQCSVNTNLPC